LPNENINKYILELLLEFKKRRMFFVYKVYFKINSHLQSSYSVYIFVVFFTI